MHIVDFYSYTNKCPICNQVSCYFLLLQKGDQIIKGRQKIDIPSAILSRIGEKKVLKVQEIVLKTLEFSRELERNNYLLQLEI